MPLDKFYRQSTRGLASLWFLRTFLGALFLKNKVKTLGKEHDIQTNAFHFAYHLEDKESLKVDTLYRFLQSEVPNLDI